MIIYKLSVLLISFGLFAFISDNPGEKSGGEAQILLKQNKEMLDIKSYYQNGTSETQQLSYKLYTIKKGRSGSSQNSQGGRFKIEPGKEVVLSQTRINVNPGDNYAIKLMVYRDGELISQDSVVYDGETNKSSE